MHSSRITIPRPNVRRLHPLDQYEQAMVDEPVPPPAPERFPMKPIYVGLALMVPIWLWVAWRLW